MAQNENRKYITIMALNNTNNVKYCYNILKGPS